MEVINMDLTPLGFLSVAVCRDGGYFPPTQAYSGYSSSVCLSVAAYMAYWRPSRHGLGSVFWAFSNLAGLAILMAKQSRPILF